MEETIDHLIDEVKKISQKKRSAEKYQKRTKDDRRKLESKSI